jgi:two-component system alkaline phosphatase synthesis response regulator PhoP
MRSDNLLLIHENKQDLIGIADYLATEGFKVGTLPSVRQLQAYLSDNSPDLILMPVDTNGKSGIELCLDLKSKKPTSDIFVILLSYKKEDNFQIEGLNSGADDFLFQPVHQRVLLGRVRALLKRKKWGSIELSESPLIIDQERYLIIKKGVEFYLPKKEFEILSLLFSKPNKVFSRDEIKNAIWENFEKVRGRTVDVHIRKIREKIGEDLITTIKGVGYRLELI